ncbi:MAG: hypothetical protein BMS9Abin12_2400 [Acidimicrobiia bacterium]|nr:MAG: hypothetical protein BMS9Abin12_2400 [Acidimicrobiia bacterium]
MKFDRRRPSHWLRAGWITVVLGVSSLVAWLLPRNEDSAVVLSGHALNGNLASLYAARSFADPGLTWHYAAMSITTAPTDSDIVILLLWRFRDALRVARARAVVTDHGPGVLSVLQRLRPQIVFIDVWHGVGFKALGSEYGRKMKRYRGMVAASQWDADNQVLSTGIQRSQVAPLGYALMDTIVAARARPVELGGSRRRRLLVAPTWSHGRSDDFESLTSSNVTLALAGWASDRGWEFVVRAHLNTAGASEPTGTVRYMGMASFPDTVALMVDTDILITDWSSIATDFHGLGRPVVFWDRPCPFSEVRMSMDDRVGPLVASVGELTEKLDLIVADDSWFERLYGRRQRALVERVHGAGLDGRAGSRVAEFLSSVIVT